MGRPAASGNGTAAGGVEVDGDRQQLPRPTRSSTTRATPAANSQGYVKMPNVNPVNEMVDMIDESRSYESDVTAMSTAKEMYEKTLDLLK